MLDELVKSSRIVVFFQSWLVIIAAHSEKKGCTFQYTTMTNLRNKSVCHDIFWHVNNVVLVAGYQISTWQQIASRGGAYPLIPVVPHKAVAEVSNIGNL